MPELVYLVATTVDGCIAAPDGATDVFMFDGPQVPDLLAEFPEMIPGHLREPLGITAENQRFGTALMGRATYAVGLDAGVTSPYPHLRQIVFSTSLGESPDPAVEVVASDPVERVRELKAEPGRQDIWLCGGGSLASALVDEIDELVLKISPVLLGGGVPLFAALPAAARLAGAGVRVYDNGFVLARYRRP